MPCAGPPFGPSWPQGVGHPVEPLPDVRCPDPRSAQIGARDGIAQSFQVSEYSGEPVPAKPTRNLLSNDDWRTALPDKASKLGPEMALVRFGLPLPRGTEWLAGTASGPNRDISPAGELEGVLPAPDPGEQMHPPVARQVRPSHVHNASSVNPRSWPEVT
jgi:hypothetical protein